MTLLARVTADEVIRPAASGRTGPVLMLCEADTDHPLELFCKLSAGCDQGVTNLAREVIAACLAADLGLPVPIPYLVDIPKELISIVADKGVASRLAASSSVAFGSAKVENQFGAWTTGTRVSEMMLTKALGAFVFDAVVDNPDRRLGNPNCLVSGDRFRIIDHELAFPPPAMVIGYKPPWTLGGMNWIKQPGAHIFREELMSRSLDFASLKAVWYSLADTRLMEYRDAIPTEWASALPAVDEALARIKAARDNIDGVIAEATRVLK